MCIPVYVKFWRAVVTVWDSNSMDIGRVVPRFARVYDCLHYMMVWLINSCSKHKIILLSIHPWMSFQSNNWNAGLRILHCANKSKSRALDQNWGSTWRVTTMYFWLLLHVWQDLALFVAMAYGVVQVLPPTTYVRETERESLQIPRHLKVSSLWNIISSWFTNDVEYYVRPGNHSEHICVATIRSTWSSLVKSF
jgi:hypothetical protein